MSAPLFRLAPFRHEGFEGFCTRTSFRRHKNESTAGVLRRREKWRVAGRGPLVWRKEGGIERDDVSLYDLRWRKSGAN